MGRGRQKAKQTKVARALKYYSPDTNYTQLERELGVASHSPVDTRTHVPDDDEPEGTGAWPDADEDD